MPLKLSFEPVTHYKINLTSLFAKFKYILMHCTVIPLFASRWHYSNGGAVLGYTMQGQGIQQQQVTFPAKLLSGKRKLTNAFPGSLIFPFLQSLSPQPLLCSLLWLARSQPETKQLRAMRILLIPAEFSKGGCS